MDRKEGDIQINGQKSYKFYSVHAILFQKPHVRNEKVEYYLNKHGIGFTQRKDAKFDDPERSRPIYTGVLLVKSRL